MKDIDKELLNACKDGDLEKVKQLLEEGADVNVKDEKGRTALMFASWYGHKKVVKQLLEKGADVNAREYKDGETALMWAAAKGDKKVVKLLLESGADVNAKNKGGWTALMICFSKWS